MSLSIDCDKDIYLLYEFQGDYIYLQDVIEWYVNNKIYVSIWYSFLRLKCANELRENLLFTQKELEDR